MSPAATNNQIPVGDLHCQRHPYDKELTTTCISCSEKPDKKGFYEIKLHDTVLFPEGGGQPFDTGFIDDIPVHNVQRQGIEHVHYTKAPVAAGNQVTVKVNWDRRWDHMQQHSGQHLLSAVLEQEPFRVETGSWYMGATRSYIELETRQDPSRVPTSEQLQQVERRVNKMIVESIPVVVHTQANKDDTDRPDSVPDDYIGGGTIRTVEIKGIDMNPCCGTHVLSTGHLQMIKLLHTEKARGGNTRLFFLVGQRVTDYAESMFQISKQLTGLLSGPPETFVENVTRLQQNNRTNMKAAKRWMGDLAGHVASDLGHQLESRDTVVMYRADADMEFLTQIANTLKDKQVLESRESKTIVLAAGEANVGGPIMVLGGSNDSVQNVAKAVITELADGGIRGGGKGRWQGKAKSWKGIESLQEKLDQLSI
ncbi:ThrRS/AlaRS common domain-containing protein [Lichtheimia hyalospora FSU 10163]|nr:ThrRS/AlaRS common domain-containing protein [Lichtheimia hyalospora FSU 10163]